VIGLRTHEVGWRGVGWRDIQPQPSNARICLRFLMLTLVVIPSATQEVMMHHASDEQVTHRGEQDDEDRRDSPE
jgi:hypothetical protein